MFWTTSRVLKRQESTRTLTIKGRGLEGYFMNVKLEFGAVNSVQRGSYPAEQVLIGYALGCIGALQKRSPYERCPCNYSIVERSVIAFLRHIVRRYLDRYRER